MIRANNQAVSRSTSRLPALCTFFFAFALSAAAAQEDYRNLDAGRPIAVEDAQPVEFRAFEAQFGIPRFTRERKGDWLYAIEREFKFGFWKNYQFGLSSQFVIARRDRAGAGVVFHPDPVALEVVKAFVLLKDSYEPSDSLRRELLAFARVRLGAVVAPKEIQFVPTLPHTSSGKIMRRLLKAREMGLPEGDISTLEPS